MAQAASEGFEENLLVVEDDPLVAACIKKVLADVSIHVAGTAASAIEALILAAETKPTLALVDVQLSGALDGIGLACLLRARHDVPVIFLSGVADPATIAETRVARPLAFLAKPFRPSQLFNAMTMHSRCTDRPDLSARRPDAQLK